MKKLYLIILCFINCIHATENNIELAISGAAQTQMPLAILVLDNENTQLNQIAQTIKNDFDYTGQFQASIKKYSAELPKKELQHNIKALFMSGTPLALCISAESKKSIEWRLYDTMQGTMIAAKKYKKKGSIERGWAHAIADEVWQALTGNDGFFSSRIAYCKELKTKKGHSIRNMYVTDFDGTNEELLVEVPTVIVAPRWHSQKPRLFYSEYTDTNVRLMSVSMKKKRKVASNFDGINMLPCFSKSGKSVVYCASHGDGNCQLYHYKKGSLECFTKNNGNNVSPIFIDDERIAFCSDYQTGNPQIYIGNIKTGHVQRITKGGYCSSPSYCAKNNKLAYHMMVKGRMQIFTYDFNTKQSAQLTKGSENKHESSWSPCGTQLVYSQEHNGSSQIISLNLLTDKTHYLTNKKDQCSYPQWSPTYPIFPTVT